MSHPTLDTQKPGSHPKPRPLETAPTVTTTTALALESQDLMRLEARTDTKATLVSAILGALAAGMVALIGGVATKVTAWGWWLVLPMLPLTLAAVLLVLGASSVLRQVQPKMGGVQWGSEQRLAELEQMNPAHWYREHLRVVAPIVHSKFTVIADAVLFARFAIVLAILGGAGALALTLLRVGQ